MFHGIGQDRHAFDPLPPELLAAYRVYTVDLFFHGDSSWTSEAPLTPSVWGEIVALLCAKEQIASFSVFGYSIGARFALATLKAKPQQISACYLAAPDGVVDNLLFSLATASKAGRSIFRRTLAHPRLVPNLVNMAQRLRIIDPFTARFINHHIDSENKRSRIYQSWISFRMLGMAPEELGKIAVDHQLQVRIFLASRDVMISAAKFASHFKRLHRVELEIIDTNHARVPGEALKRMHRPGMLA